MKVAGRRMLSAGLGAVAVLSARPAAGQGCMPSRFASPVIGSKGDVYLPRGVWQLGAGYHRATSNQKVIGHQALDVLPNGKKPNAVSVQTIDAAFGYGVTDRLAITLNVPFLHGVHTRNYPDGHRHDNTATGLGDVTIVANYWLRAANPLAPGGNVGLGLGLKLPTGYHDVPGKFWNADGSVIAFPVHPSIQLGDGGWGIILEAQGFQPLMSRLYLYEGGSYTLSTRERTEIPDDPGSPFNWAVPDTWEARVGAALALWPEQGVSASLGFRFDGTPRRDLIGGKDLFDRLPATAGFVEPGVTFTRGRHTISLSIPLRTYMNFRPSYLDASLSDPGGGGLSHYLVFFDYSARF